MPFWSIRVASLTWAACPAGHHPEPVADCPAGRTILGLIAAGSASRLGPADALEWHTD
jgi:hypothetical protein